MSNNNHSIITSVLAAGSTTSPYLFQVNLTRRLCQCTCADSSPVFTPSFSVVGFSQVSTNGYVATIRMQGVIVYTPCGSGDCCTKTEVVNQEFTIPFVSATAPTSVTVSQATSVNNVDAPACRACGRIFVSETPITLTVA